MVLCRIYHANFGFEVLGRRSSRTPYTDGIGIENPLSDI